MTTKTTKPAVAGYSPEAIEILRGLDPPIKRSSVNLGGRPGGNPVVIQIDTTGLHLPDARIVQITAGLMGSHGRIGRRYQTLIDPGVPIQEDMARIHGISDVRGQPSFAEVADELLKFIGNRKLIAHNAPFEHAFLNAELELIGRKPIDEDRMVCTLALAKRRWPGMPNSVDAIARRLRMPARVINSLNYPAPDNEFNACRMVARIYLMIGA
jgi:DNA polymerase-3 subunit epsilon